MSKKELFCSEDIFGGNALGEITFSIERLEAIKNKYKLTCFSWAQHEKSRVFNSQSYEDMSILSAFCLISCIYLDLRPWNKFSEYQALVEKSTSKNDLILKFYQLLLKYTKTLEMVFNGSQSYLKIPVLFTLTQDTDLLDPWLKLQPEAQKEEIKQKLSEILVFSDFDFSSTMSGGDFRELHYYDERGQGSRCFINFELQDQDLKKKFLKEWEEICKNDNL